MGGRDNDWCVLRTASRHTIQLAESLTADGYEAWTPVETRLVRVPRKNVKRPVRLPIMPSYVFARSHRLVDLILLADAPVKERTAPITEHDDYGRPIKPKPHADFNVMRAFGDIPMVPDNHLTRLRELEEKLTPKQKPGKQFVQAFATGEALRMGDGIFCGMVGLVKRSDETNTLLTFGTRAVKFPTLLLRQDGVCEPDNAVRKAA